MTWWKTVFALSSAIMNNRMRFEVREKRGAKLPFSFVRKNYGKLGAVKENVSVHKETD